METEVHLRKDRIQLRCKRTMVHHVIHGNDNTNVEVVT